MADDLERHGAATTALASLVTEIAQTSARVSYDMGVEFDVEDPRVARWLMLATFERLFMRSTKSTSQELLTMAERASEGERRAAPLKRKKGGVKQALVTWDDLVASLKTDVSAS